MIHSNSLMKQDSLGWLSAGEQLWSWFVLQREWSLLQIHFCSKNEQVVKPLNLVLRRSANL